MEATYFGSVTTFNYMLYRLTVMSLLNEEGMIGTKFESSH